MSFDAPQQTAVLDASELNALRLRLSNGIGLYLSHGLGQVIVQPAWANQNYVILNKMPNDGTAVSLQVPNTSPLKTVECEFLAWLTQRAGGGAGADDKASEIARNIADQLREIIHQAAMLAGGDTDAVTPSRSQWGQLIEAGKAARTLNETLQLLVQGPLQGAQAPKGYAGPWPGTDNKDRKKNSIWFHAGFCGGTPTTVGDHLLVLLNISLTAEPGVRAGAVLSKLANAMRSVGSARQPSSKETV